MTGYTDPGGGKSKDQVEDIVAELVAAGDKLSVAYDDVAGTLTVDTSALDAEEVESAIASVVVGGDKVSATYDDANDTVTIDTSALDAEEVESEIASVVTGGTGITTTYDDANGTLTLDGRSDAAIQDVIGNSLGYGLSYDDGGNVISKTRRGPNPFDAAQTFAESDLTLSKSNAFVRNNSLTLTNEIPIDDFEDGDTTVPSSSDWDGWNDASNEFSAVTSPSIEGTYSGELHDPGDASAPRVTLTGTTTTNGFACTVRISRADRSSDKDISIVVYGGGSYQGQVKFAGDGSSVYWENGNSTEILNSWSPDTNYQVKISPDFPNDEANVSINGTRTTGLPFRDTGISNFDEFAFSSYNYNEGVDRYHYIDRVREYKAYSSGSATLEWPFPSDLYEWDTATFTRTLDNETVDVYVAYSTDGGSSWTRSNGGNPISRNYSLADDPNIDASTEVRLEAELSRSNMSNKPTLDSAYRSWFL